MNKYSFSILTLLCFSFASFGQVTPQEAIIQMRKGINLGNTHEPPTEAGWNNPKAEEYYFDMYKDAGFNTVRIPVRWDGYTQSESPYKIEDNWINRIEEVVDWGLERDLWIVVNAHHDNWIKDHYDVPENRARFDSIWSQIAVRFANKSEKLIFEILNEPHGMTKPDNDEMHARVLSIIRKTNPTRLVIFQGNNWGSSGDLINAAIPDDPYLIGSFHSYDPWPFGLEGTGSFGSSSQIQTLNNKFNQVKNWSETHNIPVFLGEFACHKGADYTSRVKHYQTYTELSHKYGFCFCTWDDGGNFRVMERQQKSWNYIKDIITKGHTNSPGYPSAAVYKDSSIRVSWNNRITDNDRIIIQRGIDPLKLYTIDSISATSTEYIDVKPAENKTYYYRVIAEYEDSVSYYTYAAKVYMPVYITPPFNISIQVSDKSNASNVIGAQITFNNESESSNGDGTAIFTEYSGTYNLSIEKDFYTSISESIQISSDTLIKFEMHPTHADIKIWVKSNGIPLKNASVVIDETDIITTALGIAKFQNLPLQANYDYSVAKDGYDSVTASVFLEKDTSFTVEMIPVSVLELTANISVKVWPNPATQSVNIKLPESTGELKIYSMDGRILSDMKIQNSNIIELNISDYKPGIYSIRYFTKQHTYHSTLLKTKQ